MQGAFSTYCPFIRGLVLSEGRCLDRFFRDRVYRATTSSLGVAMTRTGVLFTEALDMYDGSLITD